MNPRISNLLRGGGSGGPVLPPAGRTMLAELTSSLILDEGTGGPTWSRATKAWGFNELGYLTEIASGCAFFGGARLVRNLVAASEDVSTAAWTKSNCTAPTANSVVCSNSTSLQRFFAGAHTPVAGQVIFHRARFSYVDIQFVQIRSSVNHSNGCANFDLVNGLSRTIGAASASGVIQVSPGVYDCWVKINIQTSASAALVLISFVSSLDSLFDATFVGDGIKSVGVTRLFSCDVTNYDASYVPEYVSVGVNSAPFPAGIDGAKYYETDWQGASIPSANLLGFRREAAATNNVLSSRNLTVQAITATTKRWDVSGTSGAEVLTNGTFAADLANWTPSVGAGGSITATGGICTFVSDGTGYTGITNDAALTVGQTYVCIVVASGTGTLKFVSTLEISNIGAGTSTFSFVATGTTVALVRSAGIACNLAIDSISIKAAAVQCALVTGLDGIANTATTLTATAADAIILQPITLASAARCASAYVKRRTGTGTISFTQDGGSTWTDITSQINSSAWSRVQITATLANPSVGFKISTLGDAIDVDCVQNEAGAEATSPIVTTTATITRNADSLTYQTSGNIDFAVGTAFVGLSCPSSSYDGFPLACTASGRIIYCFGSTQVRTYDGTTIVSQNSSTHLNGGKSKIASSWSNISSLLKLTANGSAISSGAFDGAMGSGATINIGGENSSVSSAYIGPVAIYNYQMTDAELQALTT